MTIEVIAPAKVNLALHVTGQRADGYHLLDSIVAFGPVGDKLTLELAARSSFEVTGPMAKFLDADTDNLVLQALRAIAPKHHFHAKLEKHLPVAAGIGGGSSDAAAAIRGGLKLLAAQGEFDDVDPQTPLDHFRPFADKILSLGADVPMCLAAHSCRARGIGEKVELIQLPPVPTILVNPGVPIPTPAVFRNLKGRENPALPDTIPDFRNAAHLIDWLTDQRNDLSAPAQYVAPVIGDVLRQIGAQTGCGLARMSGSGATCFGLFEDVERAKEAARALALAEPSWWVAGGLLQNSTEWTVSDIA